MATSIVSPQLLVRTWKRMSALPFGKLAFSRMLGAAVPHSGVIGAVVEELEPGRVKVSLRDRRHVRNHLRSIHAMALANLGEMATGLALNSALPKGSRAILVAFNIQYLKKARGKLIATSQAPELVSNERQELEVAGAIVDADGATVAAIQARWLVGPGSS